MAAPPIFIKKNYGNRYPASMNDWLMELRQYNILSMFTCYLCEHEAMSFKPIK